MKLRRLTKESTLTEQDVTAPNAALGNSDPTLSFGLSGFNDWSVEFPFLDLMKQARPWFAFESSTWSSMEYAGLKAGGHLDENGWPTEIPEGMAGIRTIWALPEGARMGSGNYVLTYEGEGTIVIDGHTSSSGRIEFSKIGQFWMDITATDPNGTGDYIKNIRIVPAEYEALAYAGEIFNPDFLAVVDDARQVRFMDWMRTNGSTQSEWADRPQADDATWTGPGGVPLEIMVALANKVGAEPWFNIPHMATDEYIENFAAYVRDHLNPDLAANVEYSNETWNFSFGQYGWLAAQAEAEWGIAPGGDAWIQYSGMRATEAALIWDEVFGAEADTRVYNVIGVQAGWYGLAEAQINANLWQVKEPNSYVAPSSVFDAIAITNYFGGAHISDEALRNELMGQINAHPNDIETVYDWLADRLLNRADIAWTIPYTASVWGQFRDLADSLGMDLVAYEGGSHEHHSAFINLPEQDIAKLTAFYIGFSYSDQMAEVYQAAWNAWAAVSDGPFMQFGDVGTPSKWGSWGALRSLADTNPRAQMLFELNETSQSWFGDGGGTRYQQGVIKLATRLTGETLTGTGKDDVLVGSDGNDTFIPGLGNDRINGGKGNDTYVLESSSPFILDESGVDLITSSITRDLRTFTGIENLTLTGTLDVDGTGTDTVNVLRGNSGSNTLYGLGGNVTLYGFGGDDILDGEAGNDLLDGGACNDS